jgi:hypothetical protein
MENFGNYIDVLIQAPIAVILMFYLYKNNQQQTAFYKQMMDEQSKTIEKITVALNEAIKIIKQQERKG